MIIIVIHEIKYEYHKHLYQLLYNHSGYEYACVRVRGEAFEHFNQVEKRKRKVKHDHKKVKQCYTNTEEINNSKICKVQFNLTYLVALQLLGIL